MDKKFEKELETFALEVCNYYNIDLEILKSNKRDRHIVLARNIIIYCFKDKVKEYNISISSFMGFFNRSHSTYFNSILSIDKDLDTNSYIRNVVYDFQLLFNEITN
jgi:chromosomal replication initiation ATPase DnaA